MFQVKIAHVLVLPRRFHDSFTTRSSPFLLLLHFFTSSFVVLELLNSNNKQDTITNGRFLLPIVTSPHQILPYSSRKKKKKKRMFNIHQLNKMAVCFVCSVEWQGCWSQSRTTFVTRDEIVGNVPLPKRRRRQLGRRANPEVSGIWMVNH